MYLANIPLDPLFELDIETVIASTAPLHLPPPVVPMSLPPLPPFPIVCGGATKATLQLRQPARHVDLSVYYHLPQAEVAKKLGMANSTLSRRWRQVSQGRMWPYRHVRLIDKEIERLGQSNPQKVEKLREERSLLLTPVTVDATLDTVWHSAHVKRLRSKKRSRDDEDDYNDND